MKKLRKIYLLLISTALLGLFGFINVSAAVETVEPGCNIPASIGPTFIQYTQDPGSGPTCGIVIANDSYASLSTTQQETYCQQASWALQNAPYTTTASGCVMGTTVPREGCPAGFIYNSGTMLCERTVPDPVTPNPATPEPATPNPGRTCQDDGYPAGYYWSDAAGACITDATPEPTPAPTIAPQPVATPVPTPVATATATATPTASPSAIAATYTQSPSPKATATPEVAIGATENDNAAHPTYGATNKSWSIFNLIMAVGAMVLGIASFVGKKEKEEGQQKFERKTGVFNILAVVSAVAAILLFVFNESLTGTMALLNNRSWIAAVLFGVSAVSFFFSKKWKAVDTVKE